MSKPEYETAIDEFMEAEQKYSDLEKHFMSGLVLRQLYVQGGEVEELIVNFQAVLAELKTLLEDRNAKLQNAKNAIRSVVQLGPSQWRGPEGNPTTLTYGPFSVSSFTMRSLDAETLLTLAKSKGFEPELMALKGISKTGESVPLVQTKVDVDYQGVLQWLKQRGYDDVIEGAYDEKERTPMVKGPKPVAFFGEKKKDE